MAYFLTHLSCFGLTLAVMASCTVHTSVFLSHLCPYHPCRDLYHLFYLLNLLSLVNLYNLDHRDLDYLYNDRDLILYDSLLMKMI